MHQHTAHDPHRAACMSQKRIALPTVCADANNIMHSHAACRCNARGEASAFMHTGAHAHRHTCTHAHRHRHM
eukprot:11019195-Alexandrium_andersonii.AAC.1